MRRPSPQGLFQWFHRETASVVLTALMLSMPAYAQQESPVPISGTEAPAPTPVESTSDGGPEYPDPPSAPPTVESVAPDAGDGPDGGAEASVGAPAPAPMASAEAPPEPSPVAVTEPPASPPAQPTAAPATVVGPSDVPPKHWAFQTVVRCLNVGMVELRGGVFDGAGNSTRYDLALAAGRIVEKIKGPKAKVAPVPDAGIDPTAAKVIGQAIAAGVIGLESKKLGAARVITRDDVAKVVSKLLALIKKDTETMPADAVEINDLAPDDPMAISVQRSLKDGILSLQDSKFNGYLNVPRYHLVAAMVKLYDFKKK